MILFRRVNGKYTIINTLLIILFLFSGFSQIEISSFKPSDTIIILTFLFFLTTGRIVIQPMYTFFIFSFIYAYIIGGFNDEKTFFSRIIIFSILFALIKLFKFRSHIELKKYLLYFTYSMFLSNVLALFYFVTPELKTLVLDSSSAGVRFKGFFNQPNGYAYILILCLPIALYFLRNKKNIFNLLNVLVIALCLLLTQSRGAILSILIGFALVYSIYLFRTKKFKKLIAPAISITFVIYFGLYLFPNFVLKNFGINLSRLNPKTMSSNERNLQNFKISNINDDRFYLIKAGFETILEHPFGLGFQDHHLIIGDLTGVYLIPHNYFLTIFLTYGLMIGLLWLFIIAFLIIRGLTLLYRENISPDNLFFYLTSMMVTVSVFYFSHSSDWSYFFFLVAFYIALLNNKTNRILI